MCKFLRSVQTTPQNLHVTHAIFFPIQYKKVYFSP